MESDNSSDDFDNLLNDLTETYPSDSEESDNSSDDFDNLLNDLTETYPSDSEEFKQELQSLKRSIAPSSSNFVCEICQKEYKYKSHYLRHRESHSTSYVCNFCDRTFTRSDNLSRHERNAHFMKHKQFMLSFRCKHCQMDCSDYSSLFDHIQSNHPFGNNSSPQSGSGQSDVKHETSEKSALNGAVNDHSIFPTTFDKYDLLYFYSSIRGDIIDHLRHQCESLSQIKWNLSLQVELMRETADGIQDLVEPYFKSATYILFSTDDLSDTYLNEAFRKQFKSFDEYLARGSGWTLKKIIKMVVQTLKYMPIQASSYFELPQTIRKTHAVVNIQNQDEKCFLWAVLAGLHPVQQNAHRVTNYVHYEHTLDMSGISFPVSIQQISKFERQNNISVGVIGFEEGNFFPLYLTKLRHAAVEIDLLYVKRGGQSHNCLIKDLNRLLSRTTAAGRGYKFCRYCLQPFTSQHVLDKHLLYCSRFEAQHTEFPSEGVDDILEFSDFSKQMRIPFVIYADMEAFCEDLGAGDLMSKGTTKTKEFKACSFGYQVVCVDRRYTKSPVIYRGPNVTKVFLQRLLNEEQYIRTILNHVEPLQMKKDDETAFANTTKCHICDNVFNTTSGKVRDHCHVSGKFRGAACSNCNLNYQHPTFIPVIFHNLRGFDAHLICKSLGMFKRENIKCISQNMVKYVSFSLGNLRFLDSFQFLPTSLAELVNDLTAEGIDNFDLFRNAFLSLIHQKLLMRKGIYPYSWMDSEMKFQEKHLPEQSKFYNEISQSEISQGD